MKNRMKRILVLSLLLSVGVQSTSHAASKSKIDAYYKNIYRQLVNSGNNDALAAITYYEMDVRQAIGKVIDGKVKCDDRSKQNYRSKAFDTSQPEVTQLISGFYLGYCNAR